MSSKVDGKVIPQGAPRVSGWTRLRRAAAFGLLGLAASATGASAMSYRFSTAPAGCDAQLCIVATGAIDADSVGGLKTFARDNGVRPGAVVVLDSPGGSTLDGVALGTQIRSLGLATSVQRVAAERLDGVCASACAYAFLGGVERSVGAGGKIGVHQMTSADKGPGLSASDAQWAAAMIAIHIDRMGAGVGVLTAALRTPPHKLYWFSQAELYRTQLVTDGEPQITLASIGPARSGAAPSSVSLQVR
jgi:hypothetical protein